MNMKKFEQTYRQKRDVKLQYTEQTLQNLDVSNARSEANREKMNQALC